MIYKYCINYNKRLKNIKFKENYEIYCFKSNFNHKIITFMKII